MEIEFYLHAVKQPSLIVSPQLWKGLTSKTQHVRDRYYCELQDMVGGFSDKVVCIGVNHIEKYVYAGGVYDDIKIEHLRKTEKLAN